MRPPLHAAASATQAIERAIRHALTQSIERLDIEGEFPFDLFENMVQYISVFVKGDFDKIDRETSTCVSRLDLDEVREIQAGKPIPDALFLSHLAYVPFKRSKQMQSALDLRAEQRSSVAPRTPIFRAREAAQKTKYLIGNADLEYDESLNTEELLRAQLAQIGFNATAAKQSAALWAPDIQSRVDQGAPLAETLDTFARNLAKTFEIAQAPAVETASSSSPPLSKPIYAESDKSRDPITFYRDEWKDEIAAGTVTQAMVRSVDAGLIKTMREYCRRRGLVAEELLPPPAEGGRYKKSAPSAEQALVMVQERRRRERERSAAKRQG